VDDCSRVWRWGSKSGIEGGDLSRYPTLKVFISVIWG
jgi:hypothetical protein